MFSGRFSGGTKSLRFAQCAENRQLFPVERSVPVTKTRRRRHAGTGQTMAAHEHRAPPSSTTAPPTKSLSTKWSGSRFKPHRCSFFWRLVNFLFEKRVQRFRQHETETA